MTKIKLQNTKTLIIGGAGFIGSSLGERFLEQNNEVICLDNLSVWHKRNGTLFI